MADYSKMTEREFDEILQEVVIENANTLLMEPMLYSPLRETFNDMVLEQWEKLYPEKAFPEDNEN